MMGTLPTGLVAGNYYPVYDAYYQQVDPGNKGSVGAMEAAKFLKTSGLSDIVLSKIWDLADSNGKGYLTKSGFFIALKLVALVQGGKEPTAANLSLDVPPPKMGDFTIANSNKIPATADKVPVIPAVTSGGDWAMKQSEKLKYEQLFDSLNPANGFIPGNKVKGLLMDSKLPLDTLGKIWDLADMDKDGALDRHEFAVAMHLVYKALEKYAIPSSLPTELLPPEKRKDSLPLPGIIQIQPVVSNGIRSEIPVLKPPTPSVVQPITAAPIIQPISKVPLVQSVTESSVHSMPVSSLVQLCTASPLIAPAPQIPPVMQPVSSVSAIPPLTPPLITSIIQPSNTTLVSVKSATSQLQNVPLISSAVPAPTLPAENFAAFDEPWVIGKEEKVKYDALFEQADLDRDGFVSGQEIKDVFLKSGVAQPVLAHIWSLCDTTEQGKLNSDQFALALWLISRKLRGIDPPSKLASEMVPPSCRKSSTDIPSYEPIVFSSPEVDRLSKEIEDLMKEKLSLETNITQREADIKIKGGEAKSLQGELDALVATLVQLENQKGEAVKRITDLKIQTSELENKIKDIKHEMQLEQTEVDKLRLQAEEQEKNLKAQESELNYKKKELEDLKCEEAKLRKQREELKLEVENVTKSSTETNEIIKEIREKLIELDDVQLLLKQAISHLDSVLESKNVTFLSEVHLNVDPKFRNESYKSLFNKILKVTNPTANADPFSDINTANAGDNFSKTDAFANDPFGNAEDNSFKTDPFANTDPFGSQLNSNKLSHSAFASDPFASFDPDEKKKSNMFPDSNVSLNTEKTDDDPFGCDPFAILHAPPKSGSNLPSPSIPRSESPSPALPPKKSKQPPPRPAPPRPAPPSLPSGFDTDFADFSSFSHTTTGDNSSYTNKQESNTKNSVKNDPFRDYRYEDPFEMADEVKVPRGASAPPTIDIKNVPFDPFSLSKPAVNGLSKSYVPLNNPLPSENKQFAWVTTESVKSEKERRKRMEQEKADYKLALKLSKADNKTEFKKKSFRSKIL